MSCMKHSLRESCDCSLSMQRAFDTRGQHREPLVRESGFRTYRFLCPSALAKQRIQSYAEVPCSSHRSESDSIAYTSMNLKRQQVPVMVDAPSFAHTHCSYSIIVGRSVLSMEPIVQSSLDHHCPRLTLVRHLCCVNCSPIHLSSLSLSIS